MVVLVSLAGCRSSQDRPPDLVLVTLDTTRADALGVYGATPSPTPTLDRLARRGARVEEAMTVTPLTLPAHSSLLTGAYPTRTGVRDNMGFRLGDEFTTLAEIFQERGYATGGFVSAAVLNHAFGLAQGFDLYSDGIASGIRRLGVPRRPGDQVVADATAWLDHVPPAIPAFTWVHLYDAHRPYAPPDSFLQEFSDPYLAGVAFADQQVGVLLDHLGELGRDPLVVVVADHGEGRGDHGETTHGWFTYRSTMRVPLLMAGPGIRPGGVVQGPVSVVDVLPTVLDLLGIEHPEGIDGVSFARELRSEAVPPRPPVYGETWTPRFGWGFSESMVVENGEHRLISAPEPELYAWRADPSESVNIYDTEPAVVAAFGRLLEQLDLPAPDRKGQPLDPEATAALEALGYVASVEGDLDEALPDAKTRPDMVQRYDAAMIQARTRQPAEGIEVLAGFLDEFPRAAPARLLMGRGCLLAGQFERGLHALQPLVDAGSPEARVLRGQLLLGLGRVAEARSELRKLSATWPSWAPPRVALAEDLRAHADCSGALDEAKAGLLVAPDEPGLLLVRGACRTELGDTLGAEEDLRRTLELDPDDRDVRFLLGTLLARAGRPAEALPLLADQVQRTPDTVAAVAALGLVKYDLAQLADAVATLTPVARRVEAGAEAPLVLADALLQTGGDLNDALKLLDLAERRDPNEAQVHAVRARVLTALGRDEEAREEADRFRSWKAAR